LNLETQEKVFVAHFGIHIED